MITYLIDGNNLMWKFPELKKLMKENSSESRSRLILKLDRFFADKKYKVILFFDGAPNEVIRSSKMRIKFSYGEPADILIREEIDRLKTKHTATVISSDAWIKDYAKVNGCNAVNSEDFVKEIGNKFINDEEAERMKGIDNKEILSMFLDDEE